MPDFTLFHHPVLGPLIMLSGLTPQPLRLTPQEARTLCLALAAVLNGQSQADDIYLSPIASDGEFHAWRGADGMVCNGLSLSWLQLEQMVQQCRQQLPSGGADP